MSFRCDCCNTAQPPRTRPIRVVVETRKVSIGGGYDGRVVTQIAKEENRCFPCSISTIRVTQDGRTMEFASKFKLGERMPENLYLFIEKDGPVADVIGGKDLFPIGDGRD